MKRWDVNAGKVVNFRTASDKYVSLASGGVKHFSHCSEEELVAAGLPPYAEEKLGEFHTCSGWEVVNLGGVYTLRPVAPVFDAVAANNAAVKAQIAELEAQQTPRRIREAALSAEGKSWLENLDSQITALRAQLV